MMINHRSRVIVLGHTSISKFHSCVYSMFPNVIYFKVDEPRNHLPLFRYLPLCSATSGEWNVRDADSRYSVREQDACRRFLDSDYQFMTIKDYPSHFEWPILAGLFYAKSHIKVDAKILLEFVTKVAHGPIDQIFLRDEIWPRISASCSVSVPTGRAGVHFVGQGYTWLGVPLYPVDPNRAKYEEPILISALGYLFTYVLGFILIPVLIIIMVIRKSRSMLHQIYAFFAKIIR